VITSGGMNRSTLASPTAGSTSTASSRASALATTEE